MHMTHTPLASFSNKWLAARPECTLALRFLTAEQRHACIAFECLVFELEHSAFSIGETQVTQAKLSWWGEELVNAHHGKPRHPITQTLVETTAFQQIAITSVAAAINGALAQLDTMAAPTLDQLLDNYLQFYRPLATIEAALFPHIDITRSAHALVLAHALRECAAIEQTLDRQNLALPLNLLAHYQLTRSQLKTHSTARAVALRQHLNNLRSQFNVQICHNLSLIRQVGFYADHWRIQRAMHTENPLFALQAATQDFPVRTLFVAWRIARHLRR